MSNYADLAIRMILTISMMVQADKQYACQHEDCQHDCYGPSTDRLQTLAAAKVCNYPRCHHCFVSTVYFAAEVKMVCFNIKFLTHG